METTNVFTIEPTEFVPNWWTTQHLVTSCHGMKMGAVFGRLLANKDGIGKTGFATDPILVTAGVFVCGPLPV